MSPEASSRRQGAGLLALLAPLALAASGLACPSSSGPADRPTTMFNFTGGAIVGLTCGETASVTSVTLTGPCTPYASEVDAALSPACSLALTGSLQLRATGAGTCHIAATFGDGTSSSAEVSFTLENGELVESAADVTLECHEGEGGTCPGEPTD